MEKLDLIVIACALILCAVLVGNTFAGTVIETGNWGLSFQTEGQPPAAPASPEELAKYGGIYLGDTEKKTIYLTFDAGYENGCTTQILDVLKKHNVSAAFFLVGNYLERNPDLVRRMAEEGHTVGNHTMHHPDMSKISDFDSFSKELTDLEELYTQVTGEQMPKLYRPPQGIYSQENLEMTQKMGYTTVFWSLAYADWDNNNQPDPDAAIQKLTSRIHPGAVVLLHSTSKTNAEILDELLTKWEGMGYSFGDTRDLIQK